jgi:endogenous inhibitor of DNA gyrase (YacG/DUF329 family)
MSDDPKASGKPAPPSKRCPVCGRPRDPKYDPFCSRRCADVDLHRWLKGTYVIPGAERPSVEGDKGEDEG